MRACRAATEQGEPQYGSLTWATRTALQLAANKVLFSAERKKLFLQTLVLLITGNAAKHTDPAILMQILVIVRAWLLEPLITPAAEAVSLTEKARLPRSSFSLHAYLCSLFPVSCIDKRLLEDHCAWKVQWVLMSRCPAVKQ